MFIDVDLIYCREPRLMAVVILFNFLIRKRVSYCFEIHDEPHTALDKFLLKFIFYFSNVVITLNDNLKDYVIKNFGSRLESLIVVLPDGVDLGLYQTESKPQNLFFLENTNPVVIYTGSFIWWKGVTTVIDAARKLPQVNFVFLGGREEEIKKIVSDNQDLKNIYLLGHKEFTSMPKYLSNADICVLPNSKKVKVSEQYTSPLKMFEYMASGKPIIASNLSSIRQILHDGENAILFDPDNSDDLSRKIDMLLNTPDIAKRISIKARHDVEQYTWKSRAAKIKSVILND